MEFKVNKMEAKVNKIEVKVNKMELRVNKMEFKVGVEWWSILIVQDVHLSDMICYTCC